MMMFNFDREESINKERIRRLASWCKGKEEGPVQIDVELHKRCNLRCVFCARYDDHEELNRNSKKHEMPVKRWVEIVREAAGLNAMIFNIEGINEPPAAPELFFPVIKEVKEAGMYGIVTTNGTLWKEDQIRDLVDIGWDRIHFSVHSPHPKIHDGLTGMDGSFDKAVKSIRLLNKWKKRMNSERPMLNINICINRLNFRQLPEMVEFAHLLDASYIFTEPLMVYTNVGRNLKLNDAESKDLAVLTGRAKKLADEFEIDNNFATQDKNLEEQIVRRTSDMKSLLLADVKNLPNGLVSAPCFKPWDIMAIRYDGLTGCCGYVENGENVMEKGLKEIWFGELFNRAREKMLNRELFSHCHKCVPSDFTQRRRFRRELIEAVGSGTTWKR
jgi:MoaA/NifB/PqqE/SkfB family radical SAM enzyme